MTRTLIVLVLALAGCAGTVKLDPEMPVGSAFEPNGISAKFLTEREDSGQDVGEDVAMPSSTSPAPAPALPSAPRAKARQSALAPAGATIVACPACPACPGCPACPACPMAVPCPAPPEPKKTPWWTDMLKVLGGALGMGAVTKLAAYLRTDTT